ncbi:hypothetical protein ACWCQK_41580 [Streptomyces sp. NPDC002306]
MSFATAASPCTFPWRTRSDCSTPAIAGAGDQEMRGAVAEGLKDMYFRDVGTRAMGLSDVALTDIDRLGLDF